MKAATFLFLICLCMKSFAAIIIIKGQSYPLEYRNELYYLPQNFTIPPGTENVYITMDGIDKVCFLNTGMHSTLEQITEVDLIINGVKVEWDCFPYITTIHEVRP